MEGVPRAPIYWMRQGKLVEDDYPGHWDEEFDAADELERRQGQYPVALEVETEDLFPGARLHRFRDGKTFVVGLNYPKGGSTLICFDDLGEAMQFFLTAGVAFANATFAALLVPPPKH